MFRRAARWCVELIREGVDVFEVLLENRDLSLERTAFNVLSCLLDGSIIDVNPDDLCMGKSLCQHEGNEPCACTNV